MGVSLRVNINHCWCCFCFITIAIIIITNMNYIIILIIVINIIFSLSIQMILMSHQTDVPRAVCSKRCLIFKHTPLYKWAYSKLKLLYSDVHHTFLSPRDILLTKNHNKPLPAQMVPNHLFLLAGSRTIWLLTGYNE